MKNIKEELARDISGLLNILGIDEVPMGVYYTDIEPSEGISPKPQAPVSREAEEKGELDWESIQKNFSCVLGVIWRARKKKTVAYFNKERFGCIGGCFYLGYLQPYLNMHPYFISTGIPEILEGEQYKASPDLARDFFDATDPLPAPKRFCVIQPINQFRGDETPEVVIFFARPEVLTGLRSLVAFISEDIDSFRSPFGPGCSGIVTWPMKYLNEGKEYAVLGGFDPSCRQFFKTDELSCAVPYSMYTKMVGQWEQSFLTTNTWKTAKKKIERSQKIWGEKKTDK